MPVLSDPAPFQSQLQGWVGVLRSGGNEGAWGCKKKKKKDLKKLRGQEKKNRKTVIQLEKHRTVGGWKETCQATFFAQEF